MNDWFTIDKIDDDTHIISEYKHWEETHCYLLNGSKNSLLIDTGLGIENIHSIVKTLTDKPVIAVATHIHWDHIGGHHHYPNFYAHQDELNWLNGEFPLTMEQVKEMVVDRCEVPNGFNVEEYKFFQGIPTKVLTDNDEIDLGGRIIKVLHTPGHSPGHMCFWEESKKYLYTGDLVYKDMLFAYFPSTDPEAYLKSLERLCSLPAEKVFPAHHSLDIEHEIIVRMRDELLHLKEENKLCHGSGQYQFADWGIWL